MKNQVIRMLPRALKERYYAVLDAINDLIQQESKIRNYNRLMAIYESFKRDICREEMIACIEEGV